MQEFLSSLIGKQKQRTSVVAQQTLLLSHTRPAQTEAGSTSSSQLDDGTVMHKLVFLRNGKSFTLDDLLVRTTAEEIGRGSNGVSYKAQFDDGTTVVVKRLTNVTETKSRFDSQMKILGNVRHDNVMPVQGYFFSGHEKLLLSDYMASGSLSSLLHGSSGSGLSWEDRKKIALGTAKGVAHLHISHKLVHGNIKSSNILLQPNHDILLADFGLNPLFIYAGMNDQSPGYCALEIAGTRKATYQSDVYSFGVILLELLTGKAPNQVPLGDKVVSLTNWVRLLVKDEWMPEIFDAVLLRYGNIKEDMVSMLHIAMSCVSSQPEQRPLVAELVRLIGKLGQGQTNGIPSDTDLKATDAGSSPSREDANLNKSEDSLVESSNDGLETGSIGMSFRMCLEDGSVVMVKRLKDVVVAKSEFDSQMKVLKSVKHENVVPVKAFFYSENEKFIVSNFMTSGSLCSLLHGSRGSGQAPLDWENRKKIALSTAKAIAHLHLSGKLMHGNIKSSNLLLRPDHHDVALTGFGLSKLFGPAAPPNQDAGYSAPEITETTQVTFQSDVYSLGVLILELLSGKAPNQADAKLPTWVRSVAREERAVKVFDGKLTKDDHTEGEMVALLQIAMACVSDVPEHRPEIQDVVGLIENLIILTGVRPMTG